MDSKTLNKNFVLSTNTEPIDLKRDFESRSPDIYRKFQRKKYLTTEDYDFISRRVFFKNEMDNDDLRMKACRDVVSKLIIEYFGKKINIGFAASYDNAIIFDYEYISGEKCYELLEKLAYNR